MLCDDYVSPTHGIRPTRRYLAAKRTLAIVLSSIALVFVLPVIALCALAVKLDSHGPAFFIQRRTGQHGRPLRMIKLRTMVHDAESLKAELRESANERTGPDFKLSNDPRITRVGKALRATSLDELPQLLNVLGGSMSLVGPRPTSFPVDSYSLWHTARLEAKPGITGWWQVYGRDTEEFDDRVRLELQYLPDRTIWRDIRILFLTVPSMLRGAGQ